MLELFANAVRPALLAITWRWPVELRKHVLAPPAAASHFWEYATPYLDEGLAIVVYDPTGPAPPEEFPPGTIFLDAETYIATYEHVEDPLVRLAEVPLDGQLGLTGEPLLYAPVITPNAWWQPPFELNGQVWVNIVPDTNPNRLPPNGCNLSQSTTAADRFETFGPSFNTYCYTASSPSCFHSGNAANDGATAMMSELWNDVNANCNWAINYGNEIVLGWTGSACNNGAAYQDNQYSFAAETATCGVDWQHHSIVQHELSHNFNSNHYENCVGGSGIMNYCDAYAGYTFWGSTDASVINTEVWGP